LNGERSKEPSAEVDEKILLGREKLPPGRVLLPENLDLEVLLGSTSIKNILQPEAKKIH